MHIINTYANTEYGKKNWESRIRTKEQNTSANNTILKFLYKKYTYMAYSEIILF